MSEIWQMYYEVHRYQYIYSALRDYIIVIRLKRH